MYVCQFLHTITLVIIHDLYVVRVTAHVIGVAVRVDYAVQRPPSEVLRQRQQAQRSPAQDE